MLIAEMLLRNGTMAMIYTDSPYQLSRVMVRFSNLYLEMINKPRIFKNNDGYYNLQIWRDRALKSVPKNMFTLQSVKGA